jgi:DNA-binding transcriptional MerR regulator
MRDKNSSAAEIPEKLYFKIGEVSSITGLPSYVLRFWETEFSRINPKRTDSGQRLYRKSDIELILKIKNLLYSNKFTIEGAKQYLKAEFGDKKEKPATPTLDEIRSELVNIRNLLV